MANVLANRVKVGTSTTGTGTVSLGSAFDGFQTFADGGITNGQVVRYVIVDGTAFEIGTGTFTSSGNTMSRTLTESSTGSLLNLSGSDVEVFISPAAADLVLKDSSGNIAVSGTVDGRDVATDGTKLDGIATGATNVTNTNQLTNGAGFITSADGGNAATLDTLDSTQFLRSDASDSMTGDLTVSGKLSYSNNYSVIGDLPSAATYHGMFAHVHGTGAAYFSHASAWYRLVNYDSNGDVVPISNDTDDLGTDSNKWKNLHVSGYVNAPYWRSDKDSADYAYFNDGASQLGIFFDNQEDFRFSDGGALLCNGDITAFSSSIASDVRLKANVQPIDGFLKLQALRGVTFTWRRDGKNAAGVIAQEVQEVLPEAVGTTVNLETDEEHLVVDYNAIIAVLIESVKELKSEIDELTATVTELNKRVE